MQRWRPTGPSYAGFSESLFEQGVRRVGERLRIDLPRRLDGAPHEDSKHQRGDNSADDEAMRGAIEHRPMETERHEESNNAHRPPDSDRDIPTQRDECLTEHDGEHVHA